MLSDYFDYEKLHHQQFSLIPCPFNLDNLIDEILYLQKINSYKKGIEIIQTEKCFVENQDQSLNLNIINDENRLKQVLNNLLSNSMKFQEGNKIFIDKTFDKDYIYIDICD